MSETSINTHAREVCDFIKQIIDFRQKTVLGIDLKTRTFKFAKNNLFTMPIEHDEEIALVDVILGTDFRNTPGHRAIVDTSELNIPTEFIDLATGICISKVNNIPLQDIFYKLKRNGKSKRKICAPNEFIKAPQRDLNKIFQRMYDSRNRDFQVAYKHGLSIKDNASPHKGNYFMYNIDIKDFFPSCKMKLCSKFVYSIIRDTAVRHRIREYTKAALFLEDALYIGNPISGTIANRLMSKPVEYLKRMCDKYDIVMTVYADDITFSSNKFISGNFICSLFNEAFNTYNLSDYIKLNPLKLKGASGTRKEATGVRYDFKNKRIVCKREHFTEIRHMLYKLSKNESVNKNKLRGLISHAVYIEEGTKINNLLLKYKDTVTEHNLMGAQRRELIFEETT